MSKRNRIGKTFSGYRTDSAQRVFRDVGREYIAVGSCEACGAKLERKTTRAGRLEAWARFIRRRSCGLLPDGTRSDCSKQIIRGDGNPKWRGGLPVCVRCGNRTHSYVTQNYCAACYATGEVMRERHAEHFASQRGTLPPSLSPFVFSKGAAPHNKKFDTCQVEGCHGAHRARGMCSKHYQRAHAKPVEKSFDKENGER